MTFRHFLIVMSLATLSIWGAWIFVLWSIDPVSAGTPGFVFFYLTFGVAVIGTLTILGTAVRRLFRRQEVVSRQVSASFRQSVLLSSLLVASLILLGNGLLSTGNVVLLVFAIGLIELALLSSRRARVVASD